MSQELEKLYEGMELNEASRLQKIALAAGAGLATLIGLGIKKAINNSVVAANKSKFEKILVEYKDELLADIQKRVKAHQASLADSEGDKRRIATKKRQFEKYIMDYVKKSIDNKSKQIAEKIDRSKAGEKGKQSLKVYWDYLSTPLEIDILQELHRLDIIGEEEVERGSRESAGELAAIAKMLNKLLGGEEGMDGNMKTLDKLKSVYNEIKEKYQKVDKTNEDALKEVIDHIDLWLDVYEKLKDSLTKEEQLELRETVEQVQYFKESLDQLREDIIRDFRMANYSDNLRIAVRQYVETDRNHKDFKNLFKDSILQDLEQYQNQQDFARYAVGEIMKDEKTEGIYADQIKAMKSSNMTPKQILTLFLLQFLNDWDKDRSTGDSDDTSESFVSFYDYYKNHL